MVCESISGKIPFLSCLLPLCQNESVKQFMSIKLMFTSKILDEDKQRHMETRKRPERLPRVHTGLYCANEKCNHQKGYFPCLVIFCTLRQDLTDKLRNDENWCAA